MYDDVLSQQINCLLFPRQPWMKFDDILLIPKCWSSAHNTPWFTVSNALKVWVGLNHRIIFTNTICDAINYFYQCQGSGVIFFFKTQADIGTTRNIYTKNTNKKCFNLFVHWYGFTQDRMMIWYRSYIMVPMVGSVHWYMAWSVVDWNHLVHMTFYCPVLFCICFVSVQGHVSKTGAKNGYWQTLFFF